MKYLLFTGSGIGDWIITLPMARRIKLNDPDAFITVFSRCDKKRFKTNRMFLSMQKWVDSAEYYAIEEPLHDVKLLLNLGYKKYDYYFRAEYYDNPYVSAWPNRIMKIAAKTGVGVWLKNRPELTYDYSVSFKKENSVYQTPLELLDLIGIKKHPNEDKTELLNTKDISAAFENLNIKTSKPLIAIVPGTAPAPVTADGKNGTKPAKNWPYSCWDELAQKLITNGYQVVLLGGVSEREEIEKGHYFFNAEILNLCGKLSIAESCSVLSHAALTIGCDTGMMHCSGAVGTPSLTLFGCTDYRNYLAYGNKSYYITSPRECSPCFGGEGLLSCNDFPCMKEITVEQVYQKAHSILEKYQNIGHKE